MYFIHSNHSKAEEVFMSFKVKITIINPKNQAIAVEHFSMLRGLAVKISGFDVIAGLTDDKLIKKGHVYVIFNERNQIRRFVSRGKVLDGRALRIRRVKRRIDRNWK